MSTIGDDLLEKRRRSGDPRITAERREVLLRLTTGDLMDQFQAVLDADLETELRLEASGKRRRLRPVV